MSEAVVWGEAQSCIAARTRLAAALAIGVLAALLVYWKYADPHPPHSDWDQIYLAARALAAGENPYVTIHQDRFPFYYPLTAVVVVGPLALLPLSLARAFWVGLGAAVFAYALIGRGWWALLAFAGSPYLAGFVLNQWAPITAGGIAVTWIGGLVWAAKPTIGLAYFAGWPSKGAFIAGAVLALVSLALWPSWPMAWRGVLHEAPHIRALVTRPGGALLLLAFLRWRRPEGRFFGMLALVPQTSMPYELLPVFLAPRNARQMAILVLLSQLGFVIAFGFMQVNPAVDFDGMLNRQWPVWLVTCYLPAVVMVLRRPSIP